jgi:uncharacterized protein (DUF433 family)
MVAGVYLFSLVSQKSLTLIMDYKNHIEINPAVRFGKPCVKETRISVYDVLGWLASGMTYEEILTDFPQLKYEHILACLAYAADKERKVKVITS